jgi:hypothetical protein
MATRCTHIGEHPRLDAGARCRVGIARYPDKVGKRFGEADGMLPATGANFEHDTFFGKNASQHLSDWLAIARGRRRELSRVAYGAAILNRDRARGVVGVRRWIGCLAF